MDDPEEHALVLLALRSGLSNCVLWKNVGVIARVESDPDLKGLTARTIRESLIEHAVSGGSVLQVREQREPYRRDYAFYYKAVLPFCDFPKGIFVEMRLNDADPDFPIVYLVNAHVQRG